MQVCLLGNGLSSIWMDSLLGTDTRQAEARCNSHVMDEGDMNVCLEFSPIKFDNESDDPRHKGRIDGRGGGSQDSEQRRWNQQ